MQEALQKRKDEEEERLRKEQEEQKAWEEKIRLEEEQKKRDEEKRLARKEREKQRKAELNAAGKLLTPAQKQAKARAEALLEARRAQGLDVPEVGEKRTRSGMKKRFNQKKQQDKLSPAKISSKKLRLLIWSDWFFSLDQLELI